MDKKIDNKVFYCDKCERVVSKISEFFNIWEDEQFLSFFGFYKFKIRKCFHCNKKNYYLTIKDLWFESELYKWKLYFVKFNLLKFFNIENFNYEDIFVLNINKLKIKLLDDLVEKLPNLNFVSVIYIEKNNFIYKILLKWYDSFYYTPSHIVVKDLFFLKIEQNGKLEYDLLLYSFEKDEISLFFFISFVLSINEILYINMLYFQFEEILIFSLNMIVSFLKLLNFKEQILIIEEFEDLSDILKKNALHFNLIGSYFWYFKFFLKDVNVNLDTLAFKKRYFNFKLEIKKKNMLNEMRQALKEREEDFNEGMKMYLEKKRRKGTKLEMQIKEEEDQIKQDRENLKEAEISFLNWREKAYKDEEHVKKIEDRWIDKKKLKYLKEKYFAQEAGLKYKIKRKKLQREIDKQQQEQLNLMLEKSDKLYGKDDKKRWNIYLKKEENDNNEDNV